MLHFMKKLDYLCDHKSEIRNICDEVESHCLQAMKIVHHHVNGSFDWLINKKCLQRSGRSLSSSHQNCASPCQWQF